MDGMFPNYTDKDIRAMMPETLAVMLSSLLKTVRRRDAMLDELVKERDELLETYESAHNTCHNFDERITRLTGELHKASAKIASLTAQVEKLQGQKRMAKKAKKKAKK